MSGYDKNDNKLNPTKTDIGRHSRIVGATVNSMVLAEETRKCIEAFRSWDAESRKHEKMRDSAYDMQCVQVHLLRSQLSLPKIKVALNVPFSLEKLRAMADRGESVHDSMKLAS